ncbi:MAG: cupin domain-containing protein, partial [Clostridia bacterium]|nr:cupin domain-containing protein [Clostridia bacterium]
MDIQLFNFGLDNAFTFHHHERVYCFHEHMHQYAELVLVDEGEITVTVNGKEELAVAGDFIFIFPFQPHRYRSKEKNVLEMYTFSPSLLSRFFDTNRDMMGERAVFHASECSKSVFRSKLIDNKEL